MKEFLSTREVALVLGVSAARASKEYRGNKGIWYTKKDGRDWKWPTKEVRRYLLARQEQAARAMQRLDLIADPEITLAEVLRELEKQAANVPVRWNPVKPTGKDWRENDGFPKKSGGYLVTLKGKPNYVIRDEFNEYNDFWPWATAIEDDLLAWAELPAAFEEAA